MKIKWTCTVDPDAAAIKKSGEIEILFDDVNSLVIDRVAELVRLNVADFLTETLPSRAS